MFRFYIPLHVSLPLVHSPPALRPRSRSLSLRCASLHIDTFTISPFIYVPLPMMIAIYSPCGATATHTERRIQKSNSNFVCTCSMRTAFTCKLLSRITRIRRPSVPCRFRHPTTITWTALRLSLFFLSQSAMCNVDTAVLHRPDSKARAKWIKRNETEWKKNCNEQTKTYSPVATALYLWSVHGACVRVHVRCTRVYVRRCNAMMLRECPEKFKLIERNISFLNVCSVCILAVCPDMPFASLVNLFVLKYSPEHMRLPLQRLGHIRHVRVINDDDNDHDVGYDVRHTR